MNARILATAQRIAESECVLLEDMLGRKRTARSTRARHRLWATVRASSDFSLPELARMFGRDHTTILYGIRKHEAALAAQYRREGKR